MYQHYMLGNILKFLIDYSAWRYLVKKLVLGGWICQRMILLQEFEFEVGFKLGKKNIVLVHLSQLESSKEGETLYYDLPNT